MDIWSSDNTNATVDSESKIIKNFDKTIERLGFGMPFDEIFPNGESNKLLTKANHNVTDSSSLQAMICAKEYLK